MAKKDIQISTKIIQRVNSRTQLKAVNGFLFAQSDELDSLLFSVVFM